MAVPKLKPPPEGAGPVVCADKLWPRVNPDPTAGADVEPNVSPAAAVVV